MSRDPRISLIICCYQQRPWLDLVLTSLARQHVDVPFEVILCDDGSVDGSFERACVLSQSLDLDLRYVWQPDRGFRLSRSRNNGLRCARGDVLVFVDGDSWLLPAFLDDHWQAQQARASLVCGMRYTVELPEEEIARVPSRGVTVPAERQFEHAVQMACLHSETPWMACFGGNFSVAASDAVEFDEAFTSWGSEDRDVAFRLFRSGLPVILLPTPNVVQVRLPGAKESGYTHEQVTAFIENKRYLYTKYPAGEMAKSLDLVRLCHLDPRTNRWFMGDLRHETTVEAVFEEFRQWTRQAACTPPT